MSSIHTFQWHQLNTTSVGAAEGFYCNVFGWTLVDVDVTMRAGIARSWPGRYRAFEQGKEFIAGLVSISEICESVNETIPALLLHSKNYASHWMPFVGLRSFRRTYEQIYHKEAPGTVLWGIPEINSIGSMIIISDGQKNWFGAIGDLWTRTEDTGTLHLVGSSPPFVGCEYYIDDIESILPICEDTFGLGVDIRPDQGGHLPLGVQEKVSIVLRCKLGKNAESWPRCICYIEVDDIDEIRRRAKKYHGKVLVHGEHTIIQAPDGSMIGVLSQEEAAKRLPRPSAT